MDSFEVAICPTCSSLVQVERDEKKGTAAYLPFKSGERETIETQVARLNDLGGDRLEHLAAAIGQYLRRQQVLEEWAQAQHIDNHDSPGVIQAID